MKTNFQELDLYQGIWHNVCMSGESLVLEDGCDEGEYLSPEIHAPLFENLVCCWNADVYPGGWTETQARVYLPQKACWSPWGSWGQWSPYQERHNHSGKYPEAEPLIRMNCDILEPVPEAAAALQIRVLLHRAENGTSPRLRRVTAALRNRKLAEIPSREGTVPELPERCVLNTPACSQIIRDPEIGGCICNPTTISVLLSDRGTQVLPEIMALSTVDLIEGFGNWTYVAAGAGMYGYRSYARFGDLDSLREEIAAGRSVGVSVHYANTREKAEQRGLPYLEGSPCTTAGHILTVRGYDPEYIYVSDSAAGSDEGAMLCYDREEFLRAWDGRLYYHIDSVPECAGTEPVFSMAELKKDEQDQYEIIYNGKEFPVQAQWLQDKKHTAGRMCLMARQKREYPAPRMDANDRFIYPVPSENGHFALPEGEWDVYLLSNDGFRLFSFKKDL